MHKKRHNKSEVVLPNGTAHQPEPHEQSAAHILAEHFNCKVEFNIERKGYMAKTADIVMNGVEWEIKSPTGNSNLTVPEQFKRAKKQSKSIVLDLRRTKLTEKHLLAELNRERSPTKSTKRIILIKNEGSRVV